MRFYLRLKICFSKNGSCSTKVDFRLAKSQHKTMCCVVTFTLNGNLIYQLILMFH